MAQRRFKIKKSNRSQKKNKARKIKDHEVRMDALNKYQEKSPQLFVLDLFKVDLPAEIISKAIVPGNRNLIDVLISFGDTQRVIRFAFEGESKIPFLHKASNVHYLNVCIGKLNTYQKQIMVKNYLHDLLLKHKKGFSNEERAVIEAKLIAQELGYNFIASDKFDNIGIDFILEKKSTHLRTYFQVKSSRKAISDAKEKGKGVYFAKIKGSKEKKEEPIYFILSNQSVTASTIHAYIELALNKNQSLAA